MRESDIKLVFGERTTGKTYRMIKAAVKRALSHKDVIIVGYDKFHTSILRDAFLHYISNSSTYRGGATFKHIYDDGKFKLNFDINNENTFVDHYAAEMLMSFLVRKTDTYKRPPQC